MNIIRFSSFVAKRTPIIVGALAIVAVAAVWLLRSREDKPYNVLLVTVDTLRPDRLGYNGHRRPTSPAIDALAREGIAYTNCYSVAGWTLPSIATLFTGRYPREHGATDFHWSMDVVLPTLAGILRRRGYDTRGFVSHVILKPSYGVAEGFSAYDYSVLSDGHPHDVATARPLTDLVERSLTTIQEPFFLWVHYFDPHFAYLPHARWRSFGSTDIDRYDQEIAHTDSQIARLLSSLRDRGLYDNTVIVFTSDHGEEFGEHQARYHYTLHDEVLRVPLVIRVPGAAPGVRRARVEQIDLLPTLISLLQIESAAGLQLPGRNILMTTKPDQERPTFVERDRPPPYNLRAVIEGGYKLIVIGMADRTDYPARSVKEYEDWAKVTNVTPGMYLFDLTTDPGEQNNIFSEDHPKARELLQLLTDHFAGENHRFCRVEAAAFDGGQRRGRPRAYAGTLEDLFEQAAGDPGPRHRVLEDLSEGDLPPPRQGMVGTAVEDSPVLAQGNDVHPGVRPGVLGEGDE